MSQKHDEINKCVSDLIATLKRHGVSYGTKMSGEFFGRITIKLYDKGAYDLLTLTSAEISGRIKDEEFD